jgi:copper chaperone
MSCSHCKTALETAIGQLDGVRAVEIDLENNQARIEAEDDMTEIIRKTISEAGYSAR